MNNSTPSGESRNSFKDTLSRMLDGDRLRSIAIGGIFVMLFLILAWFLAKPYLYGVLLPPKIVLPEFTEDVLLCSTAAKSEYDGTRSLASAVQYGDPYRAFLFQYEFVGTSGTLQLSTDAAFEGYREYPMPEGDTAVTVDNLLVDTTYYYRVLVNDEVYEGTFHTALSTRYVSIPGLVNTRDIGGGTTLDGKTVRQGLLIRGVELDGLVYSAYCIESEAVSAVQETFGFVYDLDLRESTTYLGPYTSPLGVPHQFYTAPMYGEIFSEEFAESLYEIFSDLADPENYPMYLHCTYGRDRTGTVVFLLEGILNMSEEDMLREYMRSSYCFPLLVETDYMAVVLDGLQYYAGDTLQERIVTFLTTEIGITQEQIQSIRDIFLES